MLGHAHGRKISIALTVIAWSSSHLCHAAGAELPKGHYQLERVRSTLCFDALPENRLRLTFQGASDRHPIVVEGDYEVTATKMADFHVALSIDSIHQKRLAKCRERWDDVALESTRQLETTLTPGTKLKLTLHFQCQDKMNSVQLCLHDAGADGKQVICRDLHDYATTCTPGPAIDGSKINAPALK
jgi:hypothetical protein